VRPIAINVSVSDILLRADKAVSVGLTVNELVTNAFKYAFPDPGQAGTITVSLTGTNGSGLKLIVEDNGTMCGEQLRKGWARASCGFWLSNWKAQYNGRRRIPAIAWC
jgi:two-component sensor histidine kinase